MCPVLDFRVRSLSTPHCKSYTSENTPSAPPDDVIGMRYAAVRVIRIVGQHKQNVSLIRLPFGFGIYTPTPHSACSPGFTFTFSDMHEM